jgi:hypothetical protein
MLAMRFAALAGGFVLTVAVATARVAQAQSPLADTARLQGQFHLTGHVTAALGVRGERVGQPVQRTWTFLPTCPVGPCRTLALVRQRATGTDRLLLGLVAADYYSGTARFYAPLRCHGRVHRRGALVPFTVTAQITNAVLGGDGIPVATEIHATYTNRSRINRTRCVAAPAHDAAAYDGSLAVNSAPFSGVA